MVERKSERRGDSNANEDVIQILNKLTEQVATMRTEHRMLEDEKMKRLIAIEEQVKYTNGRVRGLELEREKQMAVEEYRKAEGAPHVSVQTTNVTNVDWQKIVLAIIGVLSLGLTILATVKGATG